MLPRVAGVFAGALLLIGSGCNGVQQYGGPGVIPGSGPLPAPGPAGNLPRARADQPNQRTYQVCRNEKPPRGYVIVDYVSISGTCGATMNQAPEANVSLLTPFERLASETILVVCADQTVPRGWDRIPPEDTDAENAACPRRRGDRRTGPTVMRIQRRR